MKFLDEDHGLAAGVLKGFFYTTCYTRKAAIAGTIIGIAAATVLQNPYFIPSGFLAGIAAGGFLKTNMAIKGVAMQPDSQDAWGILGGCFATTTLAGLASIEFLKYVI